jgi:hypothetical protein
MISQRIATAMMITATMMPAMSHQLVGVTGAAGDTGSGIGAGGAGAGVGGAGEGAGAEGAGAGGAGTGAGATG